MDILTNLLKEDPNLWLNLPSFVAARKTITELRVKNDTAERGVALVQEYNGLRTKSEEQAQFILQVMAEHRKKLPQITALVEAQTKAK